jgi:adenylate cyclase
LPQPISEATTDDVQAYDYYLRGRASFTRHGRENIRRAIRMFGQATHIDPAFARAWAGLAMAHAYCVLLFDSGADDLRAAEEASSRAIELDPNLAESYAARIMVYAAASRFGDAEKAFHKAIELDPANFDAHYQFARLQFKRGKQAEAVALFQRASDIDPSDYQSPNLSVAIYRELGEDDKARAAARRGVEASELHIKQHPGNARAYLLGASSLLFLGEREKALQFAESAQRVDPDSEDTNYNAACFYANAGETEKALDCLERGVHDPDWMEQDTDLDPLRDHPRFQEVMRRTRHG